ncbi:MAG: alpha/beta fold hydrolase [Pseudomonadota bacterium]|nr:alpha/beta fold hydrolase [Pseudomonadota bacterium]
MKPIRSVYGLGVVLLVLMLSACGGGVSGVEGLYVAKTEDGLDIKMRRYRPSSDHRYRSSQPVLLFPGIVNNLNQFDVRSPLWLNSYHYRLPADAPQWALNDSTIQKDNLKLYSLAHYLYLRGYDVWLANFRGTGRGDFQSDDGHPNTTLDVWCSLDYPAAVDKVRAVTGKKPVIGGFSTGAMCAYQYLQGSTMDARVVKAGEYLPHVKSDPLLAAQRNQQVAGFLGLDPAGAPDFAYNFLVDSPLGWDLLALEAKMDLDAVLPVVLSLLPPVIVSGATDLIFKTIANMANAFPALLPNWMDLFGAIQVWNTSNTNGYVEDFMVRLGLSGFYVGNFAQFADWGVNGFEVREHWQNGYENRRKRMAEDRAQGDGYHYYNDYMHLLTVPAYAVFSESNGGVNSARMTELLFGGKTYHPLDSYKIIPGTAHLDVVVGNTAPILVFPALADWLDSLQP